MTDEQLHGLWRERIETLRRLWQNVAEYKECEQCRAVSRKDIAICPVCHGYRFKESQQDLECTFLEMSCHALPVTQPVLPRSSEPFEMTNHLAWGGTRLGEEQNFGDNHE